MGLKKILSVKGVHYLATRFGPSWLKTAAFDEKFHENGGWTCNEGAGHELGSIVRAFLHGGDLLILGCGAASILDGLEADGLSSAIGVDLSEEALRRATRFNSDKVRFIKAGMEDFECERAYDVILFSESLYYVPLHRCLKMLRRLAVSLKADGVFIVTIAQPERYGEMLRMIRANFSVQEDRTFRDSTRHLLIFRPAALR